MDDKINGNTSTVGDQLAKRELTQEEVIAKKKAEREAKIAAYPRLVLSPFAKKMFEDETGLQYALQFLANMAGKANAEAWREVYKQYPELEGQFAVYDEKQGNIYIVPQVDLDRGTAETLAAVGGTHLVDEE